MKKLNRLALTASMLSALLCVSGCGQSDILKTARPLQGGEVSGIGRDWEVLCIDKVEYIYKSAGTYGGAITVKFNSDSTVSTCNT